MKKVDNNYVYTDKGLRVEIDNGLISEWVSKPKVVKAVQYSGENIDYIKKFVGEDNITNVWRDSIFSIETTNGITTLSKDDFIVIDAKGLVNTLKPEEFADRYESKFKWHVGS